ncbi:hypothetical protein [Streptomyces sp. NPDC059278]|uniref:hypothetical protein n=1 Tax=Streptomyces sp. NPDC059278 TaxID=3346801 RepID=UPI0036B053A1
MKTRYMPVDAEGNAVGATVVVYDSGQVQRVAYYATCCHCDHRQPFFSPADRDGWSEVHRASTSHPMALTVERWDFRTPPWVAADGLPLTPPRSTA